MDWIPDRFAPPKACVYSTTGKPEGLGLPERNGKLVLQHKFEVQKAMENARKNELMMAVPGGQRLACTQEWQAKQRAKKQQQTDSQWGVAPPNRPPNREFLASADNPLRGIPQVPRPEGPPVNIGKRTYERNTHFGTMAQMQHGTLAPLAPAEVRAARAAAQRAAKGHHGVGTADITAPSRAGSRPGSARAAPNAEGEQGGERELEGVAEGEEDAEIDSSERMAIMIANIAETARIRAIQKEVEDALIKEYPHGVPRIVMKRVQAEHPAFAGHAQF